MRASSAPIAPQVASDVDLEYVSGGQRHQIPLYRCATLQFELDCDPVREFPSFRGQRNFSGLWWLVSTGEHVGHESWLERDQLMLLDASPDVVGVASQPFRFHWNDGTSHVPDYFARYSDGSALVIDVRLDDQIRPSDARKFARSEITCEQVGWEYQRVGSVDPVLLANMRWLSGYRHPRVLRAGIATELISVFSATSPLLHGVRQVGDPIHVLPVLYHLLWHGRLVADFCSEPLSESTMITAAKAVLS
ncbi:TnsA-like heteromeric transposase endonuclease subunit [Mycobacteroides abscessus]|uniref:TnsA-like heteromeric transposase endonuclease subunit n=1 Tax=Mycobacteroides abscessus TaxID=36809 RepID=UPI00037CB0AE